MTELLLFGASGLTREVIETVAATPPHRISGIIDDDPATHGSTLLGIEVLGGTDCLQQHPDAQLLVCVGRGTARRAIVERLAALGIGSDRYASLIHPSVQLPSSAHLGAGSMLLAQVAVTADVRIGQHVVAMPNCTLTHDDRVGDFATLCAGVSLAGTVTVGSGAYLGANASVREGVRIGSDAVLGMGAALLCDLPARQVWAGVPARALARLDAGVSEAVTSREAS